jgi:hypothetical protein
VCGACGGAAIQTHTAHPVAQVAMEEPVDAPAPAPLQVAGRASREGTLLRVDVRATGKAHGPGESFEVPTNWQVDAHTAAGEELKRLVVGPARVERDPVGTTAWDVNVDFTVYFQPPKRATHVDVRLVPPSEAGAPEKQISTDLPSSK